MVVIVENRHSISKVLGVIIKEYVQNDSVMSIMCHYDGQCINGEERIK